MKKETKYLTGKQEDLALAAQLLQQGGTVIFPTETVYGLGADAQNPEAVKKIFSAKGRPSDNPLIVHIAEKNQLSSLVKEIPEHAKLLMDKFWPGPLTLIFKKADSVPETVTGGLSTVAIRMPNQPIAHQLLSLAQIPIAAPSANLSGKPSPTVFLHVKEDMDGRVDAIIDGGSCQVGVESTVLDISGKTPILYRPGGITKEELENVLGTIEVVTKAKEGETPKSPGLKYKHYAPKAEVQILHGSFEEVKRYADEMASKMKTAVLTFDELPSFADSVIAYSLGSKKKPEEAANRLFYALRELDSQDVKMILAPEIPDSGVWSAVRNRLYRAAGETLVDVSKSPKSILLVCTGNTCRSPMAEGILKQMAKEKNKDISILSSGLFAEDAPASNHAISVMQERGIDLSSHHAKPITERLVKNADLILAMTTGHREILLQLFPFANEKVQTLSQWAGTEKDVIDPFGGTMDDYRRTADQITNLLNHGWGIHL